MQNVTTTPYSMVVQTSYPPEHMVPWSTLLEAYERENHAMTYARHVASMNKHLESQLNMLRTSYDMLYRSHTEVLSRQRKVCNKNLDGGTLVEQIWLLKAQIVSLVALNNNLQEQCQSASLLEKVHLTSLVLITPVDGSASNYADDCDVQEVEGLVETPVLAEDGNNDGRADPFTVHEPGPLENGASDQTGKSTQSCRNAARYLEDGNVMVGEPNRAD
ncbi:hypothetical protein LTS18_003776 [Coniosporium uncinatum]|uniref:Uncharacterized protein n=1 Tax=Coniosporium uncinatum TaxID=93489 RepID=A0ACC3D6C3_9PEZI|nr:hypothetical protein LTS18_003776 [Coniosporium uncinatum]